MRSTVTYRNNGPVIPPESDLPHPEVFFGQPRRLRLLNGGEQITGVIQAPGGTKYEGWVHPLSPYYHDKNKVLPNHPKPGTFGYPNWLGIVLQSEGADRAECLEQFLKRTDSASCRLLVGGWAMSKMSPWISYGPRLLFFHLIPRAKISPCDWSRQQGSLGTRWPTRSKKFGTRKIRKAGDRTVWHVKGHVSGSLQRRRCRSRCCCAA